MMMPRIKINPDKLLKVHIEYGNHWITKADKVRKKDGPNLDKLTHDAIAAKLGIDDSYIFEWSGTKIISNENYIKVTIEELEWHKNSESSGENGSTKICNQQNQS